MKEKLKAFIDKQKNKKPITLVSDILFVILFVLLLIPSTRKEIKFFVSKITMSQPKTISGSNNILSDEELSFTFRTENGEETDLSGYKDSVIFLNFWATWCPPCRAEMPSIQKFYNEFGDKIAFILVSNETSSTINNYLKENNFDLPISSPLMAPQGRLYSSTIPTSFLIGKKGELLMSKKGAARWDSDNVRNIINNQLNN